MTRKVGVAALVVAASLFLAAPGARAFEAAESFAKGTLILGFQVGGYIQNNIEDHGFTTDITAVTFAPRFTVIPFDPIGSGFLKGAFEVGGEAWLQVFVEPTLTSGEGLKLATRYNLLSLGRFVPYVELLAGPGYKNFRPREVRTNFTFVVEGGVGISCYITPTIAVNGAYRFQHISNGGVELPNRGWNSDGGVIGISFHLR